MKEVDFLKAVIDLAHVYKWKVAHFRSALRKDGTYQTPVQADGAGFPDLVLVRDEWIIFVELKSETGKLSPAQREWQYILSRCISFEYNFIRVYVWRPSDWDQIVDILR